MSEASASLRAEDPHGWHLQYWLNLYTVELIRLEDTVGIIRDEDRLLLKARIDREHENSTADGSIKTRLRDGWARFLIAKQDDYFRQWKQLKTVKDPEYEAYVRDLDRMLANKVPKMRLYIKAKATLVNKLFQDRELSRDRNSAEIHELTDQIIQLTSSLGQEEAREAEARRQRSNGTNGVHH